MKNRNLAIFICCRQCTPSVQKNETNCFYLSAILADLKWKKE